ncbi:MAG TPA: YraN family protein [Roseiflexaceae bacterium]|nr:YraN family protein [Roseiflexaceae bacterium]
MAHDRKKLGNFGEQAAASYLARQGYAIMERQWRGPGGELDLVARDGAVLVFVEVRTRRGDTAGAAEESVGRTKQSRLVNLAYAYLEAHALAPDSEWRIDVVAVAVDHGGRVARLSHIPYAVEAV